VHFDVIAPGTESRGKVNAVRFTPGARTAWHRHANGQTLHVTEGIGLTQSRGGDVVVLHPGDTVWCTPAEWHWHGATPDRFMTHLAIWDGLADRQDGPETNGATSSPTPNPANPSPVERILIHRDNREALAGPLREGRAGFTTTTTNHITILDQALAQIPDVYRHGTPILLRADAAGSSHGFLAHIRSLREHHLDIRFSVGAAITEPVRAAIRATTSWVPAIDTDGDLREHAEVCEITGLFDAAGWPEGTRFLVRRERPHPGAQLSLFDTIEGWRHQIVATDTPPGNGSIQHLEARHRAHARVEDRIRTGKNTGFGRFPSRIFAINQAWLQLALTGIDLLAWTQALLLDGELATAEPKKLRYRLLHVAARITRTARTTRLAIAANWPWTDALTSAFSNLNALPLPTG
jgi:quercetin dioxygenase-like cupin family protein